MWCLIFSLFNIQRVSTRALIQIRGDYKTRDTVHILNTLIAEGTSAAITANTNISGKVEFDLFNKIANALINLTAGKTLMKHQTNSFI